MDARTDILETVTRLFWHSDHHDWHGLASVFADSVHLDYTALTGGDAVDLSPAEIVGTWRPGFEAIDSHQHLVTNHLVTIEGHEAVVTAAFQATHEHAGRSWTLGGDYRFRLTDEHGRWKVVAMTMTPTWQTGNPALISDALAGGASDPESVARRFLDELGNLDVDAALACFADDAVQEMPYSPPGFPTELDGIEAIRRQYGGLPDAYETMSFTVTASYPMADPEWVALEYEGAIALRSGGRYDNRYLGLFHVARGRILRFREYFDPIVLQQAFGDDVAETFSLDR